MPTQTAKNFSSQTWLVTPDLLGVLNNDGYFEGTNPAWFVTLGWRPEDIESRQFFDFIHPDDMAKTEAAFAAIKKGLPVLMFENRYQHKDGSYRWLSWNAVPEGDLCYCSARDITQDHKNRTALSNREEEARFREQFIAVLGHDLRNPLSAVASAIRIAAREPQSERVRAVLESANGSITRMAGLIDDLMDFARSRLGEGIVIDRVAATSLADSLRVSVDEIRMANRQVVIEDVFDFEESLHCDPARLQQLLSNLLANALTHGEESRPIIVRAEDDAGDFRLSVTNFGKTIPDNIMESLFKPFVRGTVSESQQGLGLGLFIASEIARAHGGQLRAESRANQTTFEFRMPR